MSASPRGPLEKLRRPKKDFNISTNSLASSSGDGDVSSTRDQHSAPDVSENSRLRATVGTAIDKVKDRTRRKSVGQSDRRGSEDTKRLSTFIKRRVRRGSNGQDGSRRPSADSRLETNDFEFDGNLSESSLLAGSGRSSLLTDDERSDQDGRSIRPTLSAHPSHTGYLTLSSPEINAHTSLVSEDLATQAASVPDLPNIPQIVEPRDPLPSPVKSGRSPSPLREAFTLSRKKSAGGEESVKSSGSGGGGLAGLFKTSSRRNSVSTEPIPALSEIPPLIPPKDTVASSSVAIKPETPRSRLSKPFSTITPPNLLSTPTTFITPPTPTDSHADSKTFAKGSVSPTKSLNSVESIRHRRAQSATLPSKLSGSLNSPLSPTVEEAKTPGGTLTQPNASAATGFFSSVFSVAQKAGTQLSNTIVPPQKSKSSNIAQSEAAGGDGVRSELDRKFDTVATPGDRQPLAIETLGRGNLSLTDLGISEGVESNTMPTTTELQQHDAQTQNERKVEEQAAARAVSSAYEQTTTPRPMSIASVDPLPGVGELTPPPRAMLDGDKDGVKRSNSVRSKISGRRRKHRASSATQGTNNSIAAALKDSTMGIANVAMNGPGHRLTGFAVASNKRNKDFHQLFRSVPEDDFLIEDYSAALQRDILLHGRLYVSEGHVCFSSNILGWVTNLVISFDEMTAVEKKSTAMIFPNAIVISTLNARNTFASFVARDSTYELLIGIWKTNHPNLKSSLNGVMLDQGGTGDKTEVADPDHSDGETDEEGSEDDVYDEDEDDDALSFTDDGMEASTIVSDVGDLPLSRKPSTTPIGAATTVGGSAPKAAPKAAEPAEGAATSPTKGSDFPGPVTHAPTQCSESAEHYDRPLTDTIILAPLGKVYSLMFGSASGAFMRKWLVDDQQSRELNYVDDKTGLDNEHTSFTFDYIKPLSNPIGPRQTKCITTNTVKAFDLEKAVSIDCSTQTPDVPSGNVFTTKTRYCLMWGPSNSTRIIASCTIEWTGKSWIKGAIEKGANDGQIEYVKQIIAALKAAVTTAKPAAKGPVKKGKRRGKKEASDPSEVVADGEGNRSVVQQTPNWGLFEPVRQILDPISSILGPLFTSQVIIVVMGLLLAYTWLWPPRRGTSIGQFAHTPPERLAAYEDIWRREESALWDWLEDRVGLNEMYAPAPDRVDRQKILNARSMGKKLEDERMTDRQVDEAIRTTEEKLAALKAAVERKNKERKAV
ncbi:gram domain-containing protein [Zymoseptoria brevis]|uniref:Gram domain-containing protein n=1 Tax=Zymoseptoria brevis TaxID=1047168 RepID=A0A0F4GL74_9PEZI|nr:gram domain-containing protein [Zymoseptoria brevis]